MKLSTALICFSTLLALLLSSCQQSNLTQPPTPDPVARKISSYLFTGNPGMRTTSKVDITGTLTGTIGGQPIVCGPDQGYPMQVTQGYDLYSRNPSFLSILARNEQYSVSLGFNGPYEVGRSYRVYNPADDNGEGKFDSYIVQATIRSPAYDPFAREINDLSRSDKQVRITAITADYIDIEFNFTLKQPGSVPERIAIRVKNVQDENRNMRIQSEGEPYWNYTGVDRFIEGWGYTPTSGGWPTTTRVWINQRQLTTPGSDFTYEGKTEQANSQWISLTQGKSPQAQTTVEYSFGTNWSPAGSKQTRITWPTFTGVGTYTGDQVDIAFVNDQGAAGSWSVRPSKLTSPTAKWQVDVLRVTPDLIEGTYKLVDVPLYTQKGPMTMPASVNVSGHFKVIYPR